MPKKHVVAKRARQDAFIAELLRNGNSQADAQRKLSICKGTVTLWKRDPEFMARLTERREAVTGITEERIKTLVEKAMKTVEAAAGDVRDPRTAIKVLETYAPETWDERIRAKIWEQKRLTEGDAPPQTIFRRGAEPERLRLVEKDDATGTDS